MSLECDCGTEVFEPNAEGLYWDNQEARCEGCGRLCTIQVDGDDYDDEGNGWASVHTSETDIIDVGQPKCDGSACNAVKDWEGIGKPCWLDCSRVTDAQRAEAISTIRRVGDASNSVGVGESK